ncbi:DNA repair protein rhp55 [Drechslerella dactyloides]|uniref:DNA repair protein rhp55 n=1 Tax=Drechslerella dactyloides TaxID=74499 RepID=A0AAD6IU92_DREDA|nr:DNA repair protein rhp55 [Drechslerella dactyloides]
MEPPASADYNRHRLPTRSAAAALATQLDHDQGGFTTGSEALNKAWGDYGLEKGKLLEICGPPGSGKTAIALQLVSDAAAKGEKVCWIDTLSQCPVQRFERLMAEQSLEDSVSAITRYQVTSLAHFFALIAHLMDEDDASTAASLVVVENVSSLFTKEFPPSSSDAASVARNAPTNVVGREQMEKPADKRGRLIADIANRLQRLSASRMVAVVVLNQLVTKAVIGGGPLELVPSINSANHAWAHAFHHRILLLRKQVLRTELPLIPRHLRFVFVLKSCGTDIQNTNLSRSDYFFVIRLTETGVEDEKQQVFNAMTGAISMAEALAASAPNPEENGYDDNDDDDDNGGDGFLNSSNAEEEDEPAPSFPNESHLKRKRSNSKSSSSSSSDGPAAEAELGIETNTELECSPVDLVHLPEAAIDSGVGPFPILSQARGTRVAAGSQADMSVPEDSTPALGNPQKLKRTMVPDSDGESEDDVF